MTAPVSPGDATAALVHLDAERACVGAILLDPEALATVGPAVRAFHREGHRTILSCAGALAAQGQPVDLLTVTARLRERGVLEDVGGAAALAALVEEAALPSLLPEYVALVVEASRKRSLVRIAREISERAAHGDASGQIIADLQQALAGLPGGLERGPTVVSLASALDAWWEGFRVGQPPRMLATGAEALDQLLSGGFGPGDLIYLAARPGVGKTALALEWTRAAAARGIGVLVISREMVVMSLARRILAQASRASAAGIKHGNPGDEGWARIHEALPTLSRLPVWLTDQVISISDIERVVRQWTGPALGLLVVDYLQLVRTDPGIRDRRLQVEDVSQRLKTLAVAQRLPVLCLSSLSRPPKGTGTTAPTIHDLRESGELEHDADTVILLHRAWQAADCSVAVVKNRDGRVGEIHLCFIPESVSFDHSPGDRLFGEEAPA